MARIALARMGTLVLVAATLAACDRTPTGTTANSVLPSSASLDRGSNNGNGKGPSNIADQPTMAISPEELSLSVGQTATVAVTYWDKAGKVIPVTDDKPTYYGCRPDPECWSIVMIVPGGPNNREAAVTGKATGSVEVYAADGLGTWVTSAVTVK